MIPVFGHLELTRRLGLRAQKFTSPDVPIRTVVKALGHIVRDVPDKLPHEVRRAPAEVEVAVVAQGPDRLQVADVLDEVFADRAASWSFSTWALAYLKLKMKSMSG